MEQEFSVSVRIRHPDADPAELTKHIGLQPQHCWRAGDRRTTAPDSASVGTYRETYWLAELPALHADALSDLASTLPLDSTLALAMHQFDRCPSFWRQFIAEGGSAEFLIEVFGHDGFSLELSHATVSKMARLGMAISVSAHPELQAVA